MTRRLAPVPLLVTIACAGGPAETPPQPSSTPDEPRIEAWVADLSGGTDLVVQTIVPEGVEVRTDARVPDALDLGPARTEEETAGSVVVSTSRYRVGGSAGRYVLDDLCLQHGEERTCASPVYLDLAVPGGPDVMADLVDPEPIDAPFPWGIVIGSGLVAGLLAGAGLFLLSRPRSTEEHTSPPPTEPPWTAALRRWDAVRHDPDLGDLDKAHALSEITRVYLDEALSFPAAKWSTTEILAHLAALTALPEGNVPRVRRLLRATDRVKYAEEAPGAYFFEELDADLRAVVDSTRPHQWKPEPSDEPPTSPEGDA